MPIGSNILAGASGQTTGYEIEKSVVLGDSAYFSRTPSSAGNRKTWTWSGWVKRGNLGTNQNIFNAYEFNVRGLYFQFTSADVINIGDYIDNTGWQWHLTTTAVYRDVGSWYHIVLKVDTTQATSSDRVKLYINGEQVTSFSTSTYPSLNWDGEVNRTIEHNIGRIFANTWHLDAYLAEVNFVDGQALDPSNFGETDLLTNQWIPKKYVGTYGTNGFYLNFSNSASLGADSSGNGNNFTPTNLAATDQVLDSPTNNFATLNPLGSSTLCNFSEGNLKEVSSSSNFAKSQPTIAPSSGKWYAEYYVNTVQTNSVMIGAATLPAIVDGSNQNGSSTGETVWTINHTDTAYQNIKIDGTSQVSSLGNASAGDVLGLALDADAGKITFYKNNSVVGSSSGYSITDTGTGVYFFEFISRGSGSVGNGVHNFGQDSSFAGAKTAQGNTDGNGIGDFYYTPPTDYLALCTDNLSDPSIADPTAHFNTVLYTGNDSSQSITNGLQADFLWFKSRSHARGHALYDSVRGPTKGLQSDSTASEVTASASNDLVSFDSDGFTLGPRQNFASVNASGDSIVTWGWKAGGAASSNTDGSITSSVSANTDAGFSIVKYTGTGSNETVGHGLSQAPEFIINKRLERPSGTYHWLIWHTAFNDPDKALLFTTDVPADNRFGPNYPTSTVFGAYAGQGSSTSIPTISYCFHSVEGYSKVGSYTGNGSSDGPFIYTGFRPAFVITKPYGSTGSWQMFDIARSTYNEMDERLRADTSGAEDTNLPRDFLSNGFKIRTNNATVNGSGVNLIYLAFAESPLKYSRGR